MGLRTGIDTVTVASVAEAIEAHGERYLARVYSAEERADCLRDDGTVDPARLAARWAAKEAAVKALRAPEGSFAWTDAVLRRAPGGHVELELAGGLANLAERQGLQDLAVSVTHEAGLATAIVVAAL